MEDKAWEVVLDTDAPPADLSALARLLMSLASLDAMLGSEGPDDEPRTRVSGDA